MKRREEQASMEPRDPVAYPRYPQRMARAARARLEVDLEPVEELDERKGKPGDKD